SSTAAVNSAFSERSPRAAAAPIARAFAGILTLASSWNSASYFQPLAGDVDVALVVPEVLLRLVRPAEDLGHAADDHAARGLADLVVDRVRGHDALVRVPAGLLLRLLEVAANDAVIAVLQKSSDA